MRDHGAVDGKEWGAWVKLKDASAYCCCCCCCCARRGRALVWNVWKRTPGPKAVGTPLSALCNNERFMFCNLVLLASLNREVASCT